MSNYLSLPDFGTCPLCGHGHILKTNSDYVCSEKIHSVNGLKHCRLSIPFRYHGVNINDALVHQLVEKHTTDELEISDGKGHKFFGRLSIVPGKGLELEYNKDYLDAVCPDCGGRLVKTKSRCVWESSLKAHSICHFFIPNHMCQRRISENEVIDFLNGNADILDNFIDKESGKKFSAYLIRRPTGEVGLCSDVGKCPFCGGTIFVGDKAFNCSNYKRGCDFHVWKYYEHHRLTLREIRDLLKNKRLSEPFFIYDERGHKLPYMLTIKSDKTIECTPYSKDK